MHLVFARQYGNCRYAEPRPSSSIITRAGSFLMLCMIYAASRICRMRAGWSRRVGTASLSQCEHRGRYLDGKGAGVLLDAVVGADATEDLATNAERCIFRRH